MWYVGAILALFASVASNLGVNVQKFGINKQKSVILSRNSPAKSYWKDKYYVSGLGLVIFGSIFDFAALSMAALSIVAPIGSTTLVANIIFAHYWLKEKLTKVDLIGTGLIMFGSTIAVSFGNHNEHSYTIEQLISFYEGPLFVAYAIVTSAVAIILYVALRRIHPLKKSLLDATLVYDEAIREGDHRKALQSDLIISALEKKYAPLERFHPFAFCSLSGILGGNSILFGKMVAELLSTTLQGDNQMFNPLTYAFLAAMMFCIISQLHFLALGLTYFDALYCVPVFQCFFITISTMGGACYFLEFSQFTPLQSAFFPIGILITIYGVYLLSTRKMNSGNAAARQGELSQHVAEVELPSIETPIGYGLNMNSEDSSRAHAQSVYGMPIQSPATMRSRTATVAASMAFILNSFSDHSVASSRSLTVALPNSPVHPSVYQRSFDFVNRDRKSTVSHARRILTAGALINKAGESVGLALEDRVEEDFDEKKPDEKPTKSANQTNNSNVNESIDTRISIGIDSSNISDSQAAEMSAPAETVDNFVEISPTPSIDNSSTPDRGISISSGSSTMRRIIPVSRGSVIKSSSESPDAASRSGSVDKNLEFQRFSSRYAQEHFSALISRQTVSADPELAIGQAAAKDSPGLHAVSSSPVTRPAAPSFVLAASDGFGQIEICPSEDPEVADFAPKGSALNAQLAMFGAF